MRKITELAALVSIVLFLGCGDDEATGPADVEGIDTRVLEDDAADADAQDVELGEISEDLVVDQVEEGAADLVPEDLIEDAENEGVEIIEEPEDQGTACEADAGVCEGSYQCIGEVCTLNPQGMVFVEQSYQIREPEEVSHVFDFIKTFSADVAFLMLHISDTEGEANRRPTRYGTADRIVLPDTRETVYSWQFDDVDRFILEPVRGDGGLAGHGWESNLFQWNLRAHIIMEDLFVDEIIGFVGEQTQVFIEFSDELTYGTGEFRGVITRREAESRVFSSSAFEPFRTIVCNVHPELVPPGQRWTLADIMDCNATPMDMDLNGDGVLDAYHTIVDFVVQPATLYEE